MSWTTTQSKDIFAGTSMLIGLFNGSRILRQHPIWVACVNALMREHGHTLDSESFRTLLTEVECIINSRPLTVPSSDPEDLDPLTPNHILSMKSRVIMPPPGNFRETSVKDGNVCSIFRMSFGPDGERSTSKL